MYITVGLFTNLVPLQIMGPGQWPMLPLLISGPLVLELRKQLKNVFILFYEFIKNMCYLSHIGHGGKPLLVYMTRRVPAHSSGS